MKQKKFISPSELKLFVDSNSVKIIDTREETRYMKSHIPSSINIPLLFTYLSTSENGGLDMLVQTFVKIFQEAGIVPEDNVVIYEDTLEDGYGQSCRGCFIFKYLGHEKVAILHGGFASWLAKGYAVTNDIYPIEKATYTPRLNKALIATKQDVLDAIQDKNVIILDCRDRDEWEGESSSPYGKDFCPRKGKIPGAVWLEWKQLMENTTGIPLFKSDREIIQLCRKININKKSRIIVYCFKGSRASNTLMALQKAGIKNVKNYFASWNEWSRDFSLPVEKRNQLPKPY